MRGAGGRKAAVVNNMVMEVPERTFNKNAKVFKKENSYVLKRKRRDNGDNPSGLLTMSTYKNVFSHLKP